MPIYSRQPRWLAAQLFADVFVVIWALAWWSVSRLARRTVLAIAAPARQTATTATDVSGQLRQASNELAKLPGIGDQLRQPFDGAAASLSGLQTAAQQQVANLERLASLAGWLVFLVPVTVLVALWLPRRLRFVLGTGTAQRSLDSRAALDLFALRALATQPPSVLVGISADPAGQWRAGNATVISKLAESELRRRGFRVPPTAASGSAD